MFGSSEAVESQLMKLFPNAFGFKPKDDALMVYLPAFALQQDLQTAVAEPTPSFGQLAQPHPQSLVLTLRLRYRHVAR